MIYAIDQWSDKKKDKNKIWEVECCMKIKSIQRVFKYKWTCLIFFFFFISRRNDKTSPHEFSSSDKG